MKNKHVSALLTLSLVLATSFAGATVATAGPYHPPVVSAGSPIVAVPTWQKYLPIKKTSQCTIGSVTRTGLAVTAGHCGSEGTLIYMRDTTGKFRPIGKMIDRSLAHGDFGIVKLNPGVNYRSTPVSYATPTPGTPVYKLGSVTGKTPGSIASPIRNIHRLQYPVVPGGLLGTTYQAQTQGQLANLCSRQGDSGGPVIDARTGKTVAIIVGTASDVSQGPSQCGIKETSLVAPLSKLPAKYRQ